MASRALPVFSPPKPDPSYVWQPDTRRCEVCGSFGLETRSVGVAKVRSARVAVDIECCHDHRVALRNLSTFRSARKAASRRRIH